jgi:hypothetical protein
MFLLCPNCGTYNRDPGGEAAYWRCGTCGHVGLVRMQQRPVSSPGLSQQQVVGAMLGGLIGAAAGPAGIFFGVLLGALLGRLINQQDP